MRKYRVVAIKDWQQEVIEYAVTNAESAKEFNSGWPSIAVFPVSVRYDKHDQMRRATMLTHHLNSVKLLT